VSYQKPEQYVREFINSVLHELEVTNVNEEITMDGVRLYVDYQLGKLLIEAKAPGKREKGKEQLIKYMKEFGYRLGLLIDVPVPRYYDEYPKPYEDFVGFELYMNNFCIYEGIFEKNDIEDAKHELVTLLKIVNELKIASLEPRPEIILKRIKNIVNRWEKSLTKIISSAPLRIKIYKNIWRRNMELLYGKEVLEKIKGNLDKLFVELTIYTVLLKVLGSTILEAILGGGQYTIPIKLAREGYKAAVRLFWCRKVLTRYNINYLFERDEYDWIFSPDIAKELNEFFKDIGKKLLEIDWSGSISLDLLKRVYQNVVDKNLCKQLGEFYTPDWLAKLITWRSLHILVHNSVPKEILIKDIDAKLVELIDEFYRRYKRIPSFIDPTCGSFTFGVQYINALLRWYSTKKPQIHPAYFIDMLLQNVMGIDLNPVAVITAKVNYLLQIYHLLLAMRPLGHRYLEHEPMIPIYRIDLIYFHEICRKRPVHKKSGRQNVKQLSLIHFFGLENQEVFIYIPLTSLGVDTNTIKKLKKEGITIYYDEHCDEYYLKLGFPNSLIQKLKHDIIAFHRAFIGLQLRGIHGFKSEVNLSLTKYEKEALEYLIKTLETLEKNAMDYVWHSLLMNYILALTAVEKKFDLVLGNLPWVNVSKYPESYSKKLKKIAKELKVNPPREAAKKLDISIILFAVSVRYILASCGVVALMVPTSIFRGLHGSRWRAFFEKENLKLFEIYDLEEVCPFEKAKNQPGIVFAKRCD